jgi:uncharacterized protein (DUF885 family)
MIGHALPRLLLVGVVLGATGAPGAAQGSTASASPTSVGPDTAGPDTAGPDTRVARLHDLFAREWQWRLRQYPELATAVGVHDYDDRLSDLSAEAFVAAAEQSRTFLAELGEIGRDALPPEEQASYDIFATQLRERIESHRFGEQQLTLNADSGFHTSFPLLWQSMPFTSVEGYENYLARLRAFPRYMDQNIALMREGLRRGMTPPRATLVGIESTIEPLAAADPEQSPLWTPFTRLPPQLPAAERTRLQAEGRRVIGEQVVPAYARFLTFMTAEYLPGTRETLAAGALPDGEAYYRHLIRQYTTREDLTTEQIHQIGLSEVKAIRAEMDEVIRQVGFTGDFAAFLDFLRTDPRFYAQSAEELLRHAATIAKRMDGKLPALFGRLPRQPYTVAPVPDYLAPKYTAGRYNGSPRDSTEPGYYWVNTYALDTRPLYNLEALTFHEAVPGHHLQGALAQEAESVPEFRRYSYISAFGEGWGLYSEWLGLEAGFYQDPYSNFGRLTYAMWRACRLVVDTGVHAMGWTRQQMIDYLAANTALSLHEVETETDRYISWPGQALSYRIGYLKIRELRARAERELGERFDVRRFHDAVLEQGAVPLPVLEQQIERYLVTEKARLAARQREARVHAAR